MMNYEQTAQVLAAIQIYDARHVDEATVKAWHQIIGRFTLPDCLAAVQAHFENSTDYLLPGHIVGRVKSVRARRLELAGTPVLTPADELTADGDPAPDRHRKQRELVNLVANGQITPEQYRAYADRRITFAQLRHGAKELTA